jgi:hypothetical protein
LVLEKNEDKSSDDKKRLIKIAPVAVDEPVEKCVG